MKLIVILALLLVFDVTHAAAPSISVTPSRTSCTAPCVVVFDATGTTDGDTSYPFGDLIYSWNFGDSSAGNWAYGSKLGPKNGANGGVVAHVYETAGTYTVTGLASDASAASQYTDTITVTAADTTFSTTNTVCFFNTAVGTGCPTGATETASSDFDAALSSCVGTGKRCLFKRGDTFASSTTGTVAASGAITIGDYGSGAKPIITSTNIAGVININNAAVDDLRIVNLDIRGSGESDTGVGISFGASVSNVLISGVEIKDIGAGIVMQGTNVLTGGAVYGSNIYNTYDASGGNVFFGRLATSALMGNNFGPSYGEHVVRVQRGQKIYVANNTMQDATSTKAVYTQRADVHSTTAEDSFYLHIADNKIIGGSRSAQMFKVEPSAGTEDARIYDYVIQGNWLVSGTASTFQAQLTGTGNGYFRNNICDISNSTADGKRCVLVEYKGGPSDPVANGISLFNNTCYSSTGGVNIYCYSIAATSTNIILTNNLCYLPVAGSGTTSCIVNSGPSSTLTTNTTDNPPNQTVSTSPQFTGALTAPSGFRVSAAGYAADSGTAQFPAQNSDFFNCFDKSSENRIGAIVQAGQQQCRGVAGP